MGDWIVLAVLLGIVLLAAGSLKKRAGRKGCCGSGSDYHPRRKKLKTVVKVRTFVVDGMHCQHCADRIMEAVNDLDDASAILDWKAGTAVVSCASDIPDDVIRERIQRLGYSVTDVY